MFEGVTGVIKVFINKLFFIPAQAWDQGCRISDGQLVLLENNDGDKKIFTLMGLNL